MQIDRSDCGCLSHFLINLRSRGSRCGVVLPETHVAGFQQSVDYEVCPNKSLLNFSALKLSLLLCSRDLFRGSEFPHPSRQLCHELLTKFVCWALETWYSNRRLQTRVRSIVPAVPVDAAGLAHLSVP